MRSHGIPAVLVSVLAFLGSAILAALTFRALASLSTHITATQTAAFYLTSLSWALLSFFSCLGFISVICQHPLILTIFARFVLYHLPANFLCNLFLTTVLFRSYRDAEVVLRSPQCARPDTPVCDAATSLQTMAWLYLFILLPASIAQTYIYVVFQRFICVASREWALEQELTMPAPLRRTTRSQAPPTAAELWFTMETPRKNADNSFLPVISPVDFTFPLRTPTSTASLLPSSLFPRLGSKSSKSSLLPDLPRKKKHDTRGAAVGSPDARPTELRS